jgi:hypothetical protein
VRPLLAIHRTCSQVDIRVLLRVCRRALRAKATVVVGM